MTVFNDITRNYHGGNEVSDDARKSIEHRVGADRTRILAFMRSKPDNATWVKEVIRELGLTHQTASARLSELKADGAIEEWRDATGKQRRMEKCGMVRIVPKGQPSLF